MGLISKGGGLCAGAIAVAGSVALWNALLSLLAKRRYARNKSHRHDRFRYGRGDEEMRRRGIPVVHS
jgi:hypothetical protein